MKKSGRCHSHRHAWQRGEQSRCPYSAALHPAAVAVDGSRGGLHSWRHPHCGASNLHLRPAFQGGGAAWSERVGILHIRPTVSSSQRPHLIYCTPPGSRPAGKMGGLVSRPERAQGRAYMLLPSVLPLGYPRVSHGVRIALPFLSPCSGIAARRGRQTGRYRCACRSPTRRACRSWSTGPAAIPRCWALARAYGATGRVGNMYDVIVHYLVAHGVSVLFEWKDRLKSSGAGSLTEKRIRESWGVSKF